MKIGLVGVALLALSACGPQSPEEVRTAAVEKCERQFGRMASDASQGAELCNCMVDDLAEAGLEITDMIGGDRSKVEQITRSCASKAGIQLP